MANTTTGNSGITYLASADAAFTEDFALDLYAGTLTTDTEWLKGGADAAYPGNLDGFLATNTELKPATRGLKLVCGRLTVGLVNNETLTLGGLGSKIVSVLIGDNSTAAAGIVLKAAIPATGVATFTVTGTSDAKVGLWMIVQ